MPNIRKTFNFRDGVQVDDEVLVVKGNRVGLGTTSPDETLDVRGNAKIIGIVTANNLVISGVGTFNTIKVGTGITLDATSGVISATSFRGDGSTLSKLPTSQWTNANTVGAGASPIYVDGNVGIFTENPVNRFQVGGNPNNGIGVGINSEGDIKASGIITAASFNGSFTGNLTGNVTGNADTATSATTSATATNAQNLTGTPDITVRNIKSTGISTLPTLETTDLTVPTLKGYSTLRSIHGTTTTLVVTVAAKTSAHRYNGQGSANGFLIDGVSAPFLTFTPGRTYRFDVSDGTNALHPLRFYYDADRTTAYSLSSYTVFGQQGTAGAYVEIVVSDTTPTVLHYGCLQHPLMGNGIQLNSNVLDTKHNSTVRGNFTSDTLTVNTTSTFTGAIDANGNLDVDGDTELDNLNVAGIATFAGISTVTSDTLFTKQISATGVVTATRFVGDIQGPVVGNVTGNLNATSSNIGVSTGVSLGIGTGTANAEIQIHKSTGTPSIVIGKGSAVGSNNLQLRYGGTASRFSGDQSLDLINNGNGHFNYFINSANSFVWHKGNANELMALTDTGNLGIGITNPSHKLSVVGTSKVTGAATFDSTVDVGGVLTASAGVTGNVTGNILGSIKSTVGMSTLSDLVVSNTLGIGITGGGNFLNISADSGKRFVVTDLGHVGIKTTGSSSIELDVRGDIRAQHGLVVGRSQHSEKSTLDFSDLVNIDPDGTGNRAKIAYMFPPKVDNAQRNAFVKRSNGQALNADENGAIVYNTDANKLQVYVHPNWVNLH